MGRLQVGRVTPCAPILWISSGGHAVARKLQTARPNNRIGHRSSWRRPDQWRATIGRLWYDTATRCTAAVHSMLRFAFTMQLATWSRRTSTRGISKNH